MKKHLIIIGLLLINIISINCEENRFAKSVFEDIFKIYEGSSIVNLAYTVRPNGDNFEIYEGSSIVNLAYTVRPN